MKFKLDENLPIQAQQDLLQAGFDSHSVFDENIQGIDDDSLIEIASKENRILITLDLDFSNITHYPPDKYNGIIVLRPKDQDIKSISLLLKKTILLMSSERIEKGLWIVDNNKVRMKSTD